MGIQGRRRDLQDGEMFEPGEYGRYAGQWMGIPPGRDMLVGLKNHEVTEHEDGTITVSPSILVRRPHTEDSWHGYLERGVWREV